MYVQEIWRYPVKSMAGERLDAARLTEFGVEGDRIVQVRTLKSRTITSRTHPALLGLKATLEEQGSPLVNGKPWRDPSVLAEIQKIAGEEARLVSDETLYRFDVLPLLVATDGAIADFGRDLRRLRPNIVIGGVEGEAERGWEGRQLRIGDVVIDVDSLRGRCIMTTFDPDTLAHDPGVLRDIVRRFDGKLALNCDVLLGGEIRVGQEVTLV